MIKLAKSEDKAKQQNYISLSRMVSGQPQSIALLLQYVCDLWPWSATQRGESLSQSEGQLLKSQPIYAQTQNMTL